MCHCHLGVPEGNLWLSISSSPPRSKQGMGYPGLDGDSNISNQHFTGDKININKPAMFRIYLDIWVILTHIDYEFLVVLVSVGLCQILSFGEFDHSDRYRYPTSAWASWPTMFMVSIG